MIVLRKRAIWILLALFLLPILLFGFWYGRQVRQNNLDHSLILAIKQQDTQKAIALLNDGADANVVDKPFVPVTLWSVLKEFRNPNKTNRLKQELQQYPSALRLATNLDTQPGNSSDYSDNPALVKALLEHGADPNVRDTSGRTPLIFACSNHHLETAQVLLEHGADPNAQWWEGTALMAACVYEDEKLIPCLHLLIEHGAEINKVNKSGLGWTALMTYAYFNPQAASAETVRYLLQQGAKVSIQDKEGKTALDYAGVNKEIEAIPLLESAMKKELAEQHTVGTGTK